MGNAPIKELIDFSLNELEGKGLLDCPGRLLYSTKDTLKQGEVYFLGLNPGSEPDAKNKTEHLRTKIPEMERELNNHYEVEWKGYEAGDAPLQKNVRALLKGILEKDVKEICSSNLIFIQSSSTEKLDKPWTLADACWPIHLKIIEIVKPKIIIVYGKLPYVFLQKKFKPTLPEKESPSGHGNWQIRKFECTHQGKNLTVIGLPHLSYYNLSSDKSDNRRECVSKIICKALSNPRISTE